jgi:hypothetical protein
MILAEENALVERITLDYPVRCRPRYGWGLPDHPGVTRVLEQGRDRYRSLLVDFAELNDHLGAITVDPGPENGEPTWINGYFPGLDTVALYGMIGHSRPRTYMEVGSGNSTKVARRAIRDLDLSTRVISIDPQPRAEIDALCDQVVRQPLEDVDLGIVDQLVAGDIFFLDGSHRVLMNSDVVVAFLDILPRLPPGVHVHIHDIFLPSDYGPGWVDRFYTEQYMLAAQLLGGVSTYQVEFPGWFVANDPELSFMLLPLWDRKHLRRVERHGCSFWLETRSPSS